MTRLESAIKTQSILFLQRYANNENRSWKYVLDSCLKNVRGSFLLFLQGMPKVLDYLDGVG